MKYNPNGSDLSKSKFSAKAGYRKGTFITDLEKVSDIINNGGQIELKSQEVRTLGVDTVQVLECRIYFVSNG